jgi:ATP-dependent Clp protease adaptor protein ClpS
MPDPEKQHETAVADGSGGTAVAAPKAEARQEAAPKSPTPEQLPPWKVLLHNDDKNEMLFVIHAIVELTPLSREQAVAKMLEAHDQGVSLLVVTHKERAELYVDQFKSKGLTVTIEPEN